MVHTDRLLSPFADHLRLLWPFCSESNGEEGEGSSSYALALFRSTGSCEAQVVTKMQRRDLHGRSTASELLTVFTARVIGMCPCEAV